MPSLFPLMMAQFEPPYLIKGVPEAILEIGRQVHCVPIAAPPGGETFSFRHHGKVVSMAKCMETAFE